uniref:NADH dehydrogenase subunit 6 n=1 Tax=Ficus variegata (in: gastropods) TaxID=1030158 RepID=A0A888QV50_9CAEN|nr:NADH dehydrogenase subunit 6 [Ficus variegata Roding, 1798]QRB78540.1 NADH dehydrogenase subunit 6 [Ficus variegata Roding, 1798]
MHSLIILSLTMSSMLMLPLMSQPLSLGLVIMFLTLLMCFVSAIMISSWYSYILFLIYVGGLLVMFAYVAALSPNVLFGSGSPLMLTIIMTILLTLYMYIHPMLDISYMGDLNLFNNSKLLKIYGNEMVSPSNISILIGLAIILLINLIVVVKICYYQQTSLRPFKE